MKKRIIIPTALIAVIFTGLLTFFLIKKNTETPETVSQKEPEKAEIEYATEPIQAKITLGNEIIQGVETGQGSVGDDVNVTTINGYDVPTVEAVESTTPVTEEVECPEGEECGRGAVFPIVDISTPQAFANAIIGQCIDVDGYYGSQCWDAMATFFLNYTGHTLYTCGTGAAKGTIADGCWQQNAGEQFTMIWDPTQIQAGDIAVYSTGTWGHIGMSMGEYNNGYFTLLGANQGGHACYGGGGAVNIINLSTRDFIGAFRPNIYIKTEPEPEPEIDVCKFREVIQGDTLGRIMQECKGEIVWGEAMNEYARHWYSTTVQAYPTVFDGWISTGGYGLFYGDTIEYRE